MPRKSESHYRNSSQERLREWPSGHHITQSELLWDSVNKRKFREKRVNLMAEENLGKSIISIDSSVPVFAQVHLQNCHVFFRIQNGSLGFLGQTGLS